MGILRIYPKKSNTIASGQLFKYFNSAQNPVTDLWYGGGIFVSGYVYREHTISRHLLQFDLSELQNKINTYEINPNSIVSYRLRMKNAIPSDKVLEPEFEHNILDKKVAQSFDLIAFMVNKSWDEGRGYDLTDNYYLARQRGDLKLTGYSNWLSATTITSWDEEGIYYNPTASTAYYSIQHFETGNEDINMDITDMVNAWLNNTKPNNGLAIAFSKPYEDISANTRFIASFFTQKTNSAFKPYIEVVYNQVIKDDRNQVSNNRPSRLYLYTFSGNTPVNYFSAGTVSIQTLNGSDVYTGLSPVHQGLGVYYVEVLMSAATKGQKFKDVWYDVTFDPNYDRTTIVQNFEVKNNFFSSNAKDLNDYVITNYGIDNNSIILPEEVRRIYIDARVNFSLNRPYVEYGLEYRLVMNDNIEMIPWTSVHSAVINSNYKSYIDIDASWLLTNQSYTIWFRVNDLGVKKTLPDPVRFRVQEKLLPR